MKGFVRGTNLEKNWATIAAQIYFFLYNWQFDWSFEPPTPRMPQTPETITLSTFSMTGLALYGYKLAKVPFLHYFWQQFYLGAKDNQKACIQSTIVILTLLRLHHMKKNTGMWCFTPPNTKLYQKTSGFLQMFSGK